MLDRLRIRLGRRLCLARVLLLLQRVAVSRLGTLFRDDLLESGDEEGQDVSDIGGGVGGVLPVSLTSFAYLPMDLRRRWW